MKGKLPRDISRCFDNECPLKDECLRYTDRWHGNWIADFKPQNGKCKSQIKNNQSNFKEKNFLENE